MKTKWLFVSSLILLNFISKAWPLNNNSFNNTFRDTCINKSILTTNNYYKHKVNLVLLDNLIYEKINDYRRANGLCGLQKSDTLKGIANKEINYTILRNGEKSDSIVNYLKTFYGDKVLENYNSSIITFWNLSNINDWENLEDRLAQGYLLQYIKDKKTSVLLVNKDKDFVKYNYQIGLASSINDNILYVSEVIYVFK